jgi:hypothetical protein
VLEIPVIRVPLDRPSTVEGPAKRIELSFSRGLGGAGFLRRRTRDDKTTGILHTITDTEDFWCMGEMQ